MVRAKIRPAKYIQSFLQSQTGSATIEAVIWVPIMVFLIVIIANFSLIFHGKASALRLVQDSNRALSVGHVTSTSEVEALIRKELEHIGDRLSVSTTISAGIIKTVLIIPASAFTSSSGLPFLSGIDVTIAEQHFLEQ